MKSIRGKLVAALLPAWLALLLVGALGLQLFFESFLVRHLDEGLDVTAQAIATLVFDDGKELELEFADELKPELTHTREPEYFEIVLEDGSVLARSHSLGDAHIAPANVRAEELQHWDATLPDGRRGRGVTMHVQAHYEPADEAAEMAPHDPTPFVWVHIARGRGDIDRMLTQARWTLAVTTLLLAVGVTLSVMRAIRAGLAPLDRLSAVVARIDEHSLALDVPHDRLPRELQPIRARLDDLLGRLRDAFARERRFTSAAAHELSTPIAELRTLAEVALRWPGDAAQVERTVRDALNIAIQMEELVASLLSLTQVETGRYEIAERPVALLPLVEHLLGPHVERAKERELALAVEVAPTLVLRTDETLLRGILRNLIDNAIAYTPRGGRVHVNAEQADGAIVLEVENTNTELAAADLERMTEPFWRKDDARVDHGHSGLGLTLAAAFAQTLGAEITFALTEDRSLRTRVRFPQARESV